MWITLLLSYALAVEPKPTGTSVPVLPIAEETHQYSVGLIYSPFDLAIPHKYGMSVGYFDKPERLWEFEVVHGGVSSPWLVKYLGSMTDRRYSVMARNFSDGGSFNFSYGVTYFDFRLDLGDEILNRVTNGTIPNIDVLRLQSFGVNVGFGHRWNFYKDMSFGIDWITLSQPIFIMNEQSVVLDYMTNPDDREKVSDFLREISYIPRISVLKMQLTIEF
jgi:hypothetical protein